MRTSWLPSSRRNRGGTFSGRPRPARDPAQDHVLQAHRFVPQNLSRSGTTRAVQSPPTSSASVDAQGAGKGGIELARRTPGGVAGKRTTSRLTAARIDRQPVTGSRQRGPAKRQLTIDRDLQWMAQRAIAAG
jgi:hypothetical protein